jgi:hypothetical protein
MRSGKKTLGWCSRVRSRRQQTLSSLAEKTARDPKQISACAANWSCFAGPLFLWTGTIRDGAGDGGVCVTGRNIRGRMRLSGNGQAVPRTAHGEGSHDGHYPRYPRWLGQCRRSPSSQ